MKWLKTVASAFFPQVCSGCRAVVNEGEYFCDYCFELLDRTAKDKLCPKCGLPKNNCYCNKYIFRFDGCTAPFYTNGPAKEAMYRFKFRRREHIAPFFAEQMALSVRQSFPDIRFDYICYVPLYPANERKRGYNQSRLLSLELSRILGIPVYEKLLGCKKKRKNQHKLPHKLRFDNVNEKYFCSYNVENKNILLVDDIKTTGATLDECAKQLLRSGAGRIYCVTGLITKRKDK